MTAFRARTCRDCCVRPAPVSAAEALRNMRSSRALGAEARLLQWAAAIRDIALGTRSTTTAVVGFPPALRADPTRFFIEEADGSDASRALIALASAAEFRTMTAADAKSAKAGARLRIDIHMITLDRLS